MVRIEPITIPMQVNEKRGGRDPIPRGQAVDASILVARPVGHDFPHPQSRATASPGILLQHWVGQCLEGQDRQPDRDESACRQWRRWTNIPARTAEENMNACQYQSSEMRGNRREEETAFIWRSAEGMGVRQRIGSQTPFDAIPKNQNVRRLQASPWRTKRGAYGCITRASIPPSRTGRTAGRH